MFSVPNGLPGGSKADAILHSWQVFENRKLGRLALTHACHTQFDNTLFINIIATIRTGLNHVLEH